MKIERFILLFAFLCVGANVEAYDFEADGIYYNKLPDENSVEVTYRTYDNGGYSGYITIPSFVSYEDATYNVIRIGNSAFYNSDLIEVKIPDCVSEINAGAFSGCSCLKSINIPNSVTIIKGSTFFGCSSLESITIPNSVTSIEDCAFLDCSGLTSIIIPNSVTSIGTMIFSGCIGLISINIPNSLTTINYATFRGCSGLTSITIPNSVTSIQSEAFSYCSGLTSITIPNSVTSINDYAFKGCTSLPVINGLRYADTYLIEAVDKTQSTYIIKEGTKWIGADAFRGCFGLTSITIPNSVMSIGSDAFNGCSVLSSIIVESDNNVYDSRLNCDAIIETASNTMIVGCKNTIIPNSVTSIGSHSFLNCSGLTSITIPNSVTSINDYAFKGCTSLPVINGLRYADTYLIEAVDKTKSTYIIKEGTKWIGADTFFGCSGLTSITIPNSVTSIEGGAFYNCTALQSITIPNSVTSIGGNSFHGCSGLTSITIPNSVTKIDYFAFYGCNKLSSILVSWIDPLHINNETFDNYSATLYVPVISISKYETADVWKNFSKIVGSKSVSVQQVSNTQTSLTFMVSDVSDKSYSSEEMGVMCDGVYYKANAEGLVKIEYLEPNSRYAVYGYVKYEGRYYVMESYTNSWTKSISPQIAISNIFADGAFVRGVYEIGDAHVFKTTFSSSLYGDETEYRNDKFMLTGLEPDTDYLLYYKVYYHFGENDENSGCALVEQNFTTAKLKMTLLPPRNVSGSSSVVAAETNLSADETGAGFEWRKYDAPDILPSSRGNAVIYDGKMEGRINNLQPVYYKVRPFYASASGRIYYDDDWSAFDPTDFSFFEPTVHTYDLIENPSTNAVEVRGYVMQGTDDVQEQGFEYWKTGSSRMLTMAASRTQEANSDNEVMRVQVTGQVMIVTLNDLDYESFYTVRAYVTTKNGTVYGEERTFITPENPSTDVPKIMVKENTIPSSGMKGLYDLHGQSIEQISKPGIYIYNGKKIILNIDMMPME